MARQRIALHGVLLLILCAAVGALFVLVRSGPVRQFLHRQVAQTPVPVPQDPAPFVVYVLGGTQPSLEKRFAVAARLYRTGAVDRVIFFSASGVTVFDAALGRNLTNREWAARRLQELGIGPNSVEHLDLQASRPPGTWNEARAMARLVRERGYARVVLVTSAHHGRRTWLAFSAAFHRQPNVLLGLAAADDEAGPGELLIEYAKLFLYRALLPCAVDRENDGAASSSL